MPQLVRSSLVACPENSGPPSDVRVVGMPNVVKVSMRVAARPLAPLFVGDTIGQPEYLSTSTRYVDPWWWKKSAQMCWNGYSDWTGVVEGIGGWEGALPLQIEHLSLRVLMSVVMPGQYMDDFALAVMPVIP